MTANQTLISVILQMSMCFLLSPVSHGFFLLPAKGVFPSPRRPQLGQQGQSDHFNFYIISHIFHTHFPNFQILSIKSLKQEQEHQQGLMTNRVVQVSGLFPRLGPVENTNISPSPD